MGKKQQGTFKDALLRVLPNDGVEFLTQIHNKFENRRQELLAERSNKPPAFLKETEWIRNDPSWKVAPPPKDLECRYVEITGPTDAKMMINGLNSQADVYMADFEDATSPTFDNIMNGQKNLMKAIDGALELKTETKTYRLNAKTAVLFVRPRGLHLPETHFYIEDTPIAGSFFDAGLFLYHNAHKRAPYFYLPKIESCKEAELWRDFFQFAEEYLKLPKHTIRCTVLIETIPAAFQMEEILYALKDSITALNAGRWDYIFSIIKKFQNTDLIFPDRKEITMQVPFMRAYTNLLVHTCHKRGAHAMGGMSAFIPKRGDDVVNANAFAKVIEDKELEVATGFDGTWVAHPDLVPIARKVFEDKLNTPHQKSKVPQRATDGLLNFPKGIVTKSGVEQNVRISLAYLSAWLSGQGAVALDNLMEDLATCEIARAELWQWIHHKAHLQEGGLVTKEMIEGMLTYFAQELVNESYPYAKQLSLAKKHLQNCIFSPKFIDFLSLECIKEI